MRKILAFVVLLFFSVHIFEPGEYFFIQASSQDAHFGHSHDDKTSSHESHGHPCCTGSTIDAVVLLPDVVILFIFNSVRIEYLSFILLVFIFVRYSSRAPPQFI